MAHDLQDWRDHPMCTCTWTKTGGFPAEVRMPPLGGCYVHREIDPDTMRQLIRDLNAS